MQAVCFIVSKYRCTNAKRIGTGKNHSLAKAAPAEGTFWGRMLALGSKLGIEHAGLKVTRVSVRVNVVNKGFVVRCL